MQYKKQQWLESGRDLMSSYSSYGCFLIIFTLRLLQKHIIELKHFYCTYMSSLYLFFSFQLFLRAGVCLDENLRFHVNQQKRFFILFGFKLFSTYSFLSYSFFFFPLLHHTTEDGEAITYLQIETAAARSKTEVLRKPMGIWKKKNNHGMS